jgi:predicted NAD-dependent protein-ADP-ribosyltransferase YbiA (DUF1768 family)
MKAHLAYLTATRYLFAEKQHTTEEKAIKKEKAQMNRPEGAAKRLGRVRHALWLLAALVIGLGDGPRHAP